MTDELLPCPFCGAVPEVISDGKREWALVEHNDGCLYPTWPKHEISSCDFDAWNRRSDAALKYAEKELEQANGEIVRLRILLYGIWTRVVATHPSRDFPDFDMIDNELLWLGVKV